MNLRKLSLLFIALLLLLSSCVPISDQISDLIDDSLLPVDPDQRVDQIPETEEAFGISSHIHGFGMGSATFIRAENFDQSYSEMSEIGVRYIREEFPMASIQHSQTFYDFLYPWNFDQMIQSAKNYNLEIVGLLTYGPDPSVTYDDDEIFLKLWEGYVLAVVDRYGDAIIYWQIGNEMNSLKFWNKVRKDASYVEIDLYAKMLESAYRIIKNKNPMSVVILGGLINDADFSGGYSPISFMIELHKHSQNRYFDVVGLHTYWGPDMPETPRPQRITLDYKNLSMADYTQLFADEIEHLYGETIPIWITEVGYDQSWLDVLASKYKISSVDVQAIALARVYTSLLSIPNVEAVFWYSYENDDSNQQFALNPLGKKGYQTLSNVLTGTTPMGQFLITLDTGQAVENSYEYRFQKSDGEIVSVYWKNIHDVDFLQAKMVDLVTSPASGYQIERGINIPGLVVEQDHTELGIFEKPEIIIGKMDDNTRLVVFSREYDYDVGSIEINPIDGAKMVYVPEGVFIRGTNDPDAHEFYKPAREIFISAFWMYQTEVTNAQFAKFVESTDYVTTAEELESVPFFAGYGLDVMMFYGGYWNNLNDDGYDIPFIEDHPVVYMSWYDANAYCEWAGGRLPTEAEWEKAARGTDNRSFPWGDSPVTGDKANYCDVSCAGFWKDDTEDDGYHFTSPVGNYPSGASYYGVFDLAGNVEEYVSDWFDLDYYQYSPDANPSGPEHGESKIARGGTYISEESGLQVTRRNPVLLDFPWNTSGFRCVIDHDNEP